MEQQNEFEALSPDLLEIAYSKNWFRLFVKKEFGGVQANLALAMSTLFEAASIDGSLGWCVNLGSGASYFSGFLNPEIVIQLLGNRENAFAGSGAIGKAVRKENHYMISGIWPRCTGAAHATAFTVNAMLEDGSVRSFILPRQEVKISNNWTLMGLQASSTYQIEADQIAIPLSNAFEIGSLHAASAYTIHYIPFEPFARCCMISSLLGMTACFISKVEADLLLVERKGIAEEIAGLSTLIDERLIHFTNLGKELEKHCSLETDPTRLVNKITRDITETAVLIREKINAIYYLGGLQLADIKNPANIAFRDLLVAGQHNLFR